MDLTRGAIIYQYAFGVSAGLSAMAAGAWLSWPSSTNRVLLNGTEGVQLDRDQISTMVALMDFGNILSPIPSGYLMDFMGRKMTLIISCLTYLISSASVLFYKHATLIYIARIMAGMGKGISFAVVPIYLAEIANVQIRGGLSTMFIGFLNLGMLYSYLIGPYVSYTVLNVALFIIPILFISSILFFPESPYYLLMKNKKNKALASLSKYRRIRVTDEVRQGALENELDEMATRVARDMKNKGRFMDLVTTKGNRKALLIIALLAFFQRSSGISPTIAYSTVIVPPQGGGISVHEYMILFAILLVVANYAALPFVDTLGRKPLLLISSIATALITLLDSAYYFLHHYGYDVTSIQWIPYLCLILFPITYSLGIGFLPSTLVGELFPTNVKSYAGSVSAIILAAVSFTVNKIFLFVSKTWGPHVMYWYFTISCIACAVFVQFYVIETKGKTFGEIQSILQNEPVVKQSVEVPLVSEAKRETSVKMKA